MLSDLAKPRLALTLFWRTFALLALLLSGGVLAWQQTFKVLEAEPRALESAQQLAGLVNLSRVALANTDSINRVAMLSTLARSDAVQVRVAEQSDRWQAYDANTFAKRLAAELRERLGPGTVVARSVNQEPGLWVRFSIGEDAYWLQTSAAPLSVSLSGNAWWLGIALIATALGSALITRLINQPLRELSFAAHRIREGEYDSRLDESTRTSEIREVNMGFNRMARELAKMEDDRAVMLAGISHDLRTPLARLRLEAEMSVADEQARQFMAQDIAQLDAIINKFMDYARPSEVQLKPIALAELAEREALGFRKPEEIRILVRLPAELRVWADETELARVLLNLFENARRYGHAPGEASLVIVSHRSTGPWVDLLVRDFGPGVPADKMDRLTTPFFRGDSARTAATGAGLGLAIVEKSVQRLGGQLQISNARGGGLQTIIRLQKAQ
ncbi:two-component system osmolarity sensor histidine kinase EnvZ [Paucibacter oligotrophus]|uniref:histidine kinase n=1 Tax=Roseateles oligotrophus TaxID=1769250 RepID=A0A840L5H1_9BURK|nr:two-component system osmolarity sensor histidine kinase EnvZ [Roseateles oligotrophus]